MEEIKLEDLVPQGASFTLRKTGKSYRLKAVSLGDELWMQQTFGDTLEEVFSQIKMKEICRIVFRLLLEEDKSDFAATTVTFMNEEGETREIRVGGAELLYLNVSGFNEKIDIFQALMQTLGVSRPILEKLTGVESLEKKTQKPIGPEFSIKSPTSMVGRPSTFSRARRENSRPGSKRLKKGKSKS